MSAQLLITGGVALALLAGGAGYKLGTDLCEGRHARAALEQVKADEAAGDAVADVGTAHASAESARQAATKTIIREVPYVVTRPVYRNVCLDADGVRLLDAAVDAANGADQPAAARTDPGVPAGAPEG